MEKEMTLRGLIVSKFGSILEFSKALGWSYAKTYRATKNVGKLTVDDARVLGQALGATSGEDIAALFFSTRA